MNDKKNIKEIDLTELIQKLQDNRKSILKTIGIGFIIGFIVAISLPKTYKVDIALSPESGSNGSSGNLAGMASMLGIGGIGGANQDAVNSTMFPDLIKSTPFILEMYNVKVTPLNSKKTISLSEYIETQKKPWWNYVLGLPGKAIGGIISLFSSEKKIDENKDIDPFRLTGEQNSKINAIKGALLASEDKKNGMTIVSATFQDPEVAATVADSAVAKLQKYIIDYRTRKAQED